MKIKTIITNWKTTLLGILPAGLALLIAVGVIDFEQQTAIIDGVEVVFDAADSVLNDVIGVIAAVSGIIGLFSRDADKSSEASGAN